MSNDPIPVTVVVPTHPAREANGMLGRALASINAQTRAPQEVIVQYDNHKWGAARTRQLGLQRVETEWVTFLDSDDEMLPGHLESMYDYALETESDLVYPWYTVVGSRDPMPRHFGKPWDPKNPRLTTIVTLCRTEIAQQVGFIQESSRETESGEDWYFIRGINNLGAKIVHLPKRTWLWHHHGKNSSGLPTKGDAKR